LFSVRLGKWSATASVRAQLLARYEVFAALFRRIKIFFSFPKFTPIYHPSPYHSSETSGQMCHLTRCKNVLCESLKTYIQHAQLPFLPTGLAAWRPTVGLHLSFTAHLFLVPPLYCAMQNGWDESCFNAASRLMFHSRMDHLIAVSNSQQRR
jgi:hypothetical protein